MTRSRRRGNVATEGSVIAVVVALAIVGDLWRRQRAPQDEPPPRVVELGDEPAEAPEELPPELPTGDGE